MRLDANSRYPYQVVAFFDQEPSVGDFVYGGKNGWLPQVAIRRRFGFDDERLLCELLEVVAETVEPLSIRFGTVARPNGMPVDIIQVVGSPGLMRLHQRLFAELGNPKYPQREGDGYSPHITISWEGRRVVKANNFVKSSKRVSRLWLLKDDGSDSRAIAAFDLGRREQYASVILLTNRQEVILQLRDNNPKIVDPNKLSLFGGRLHKEETPIDGARRELLEETSLRQTELTFFEAFRTRLDRHGRLATSHVYIARDIDLHDVNVREGQGYVLVRGQRDLAQYDVALISQDILTDFFAST